MTLCRSERIPLPARELDRVRHDARTTIPWRVEALEQERVRLEHERDQLRQRLNRAWYREATQRRLIGELRRQRGQTRRRSDGPTCLALEKP